MITLECNGVEQSLEGWGITKAVLLFVSLGIDRLTFDISVPDMFADQAFDYGDTVNLFDDGTRVFQGQITTMPVVGTSTSDTQSYVASGPWWILARIGFLQDRTFFSSMVKTVEESSRLVLFMGTSVADPVTAQTQILKAIQYGVVKFGIPIQFGGVTLDIQPPMTEVKDITCADAIVAAAKWTPDAVAWFDYAVDPPAFYCKRRDDLDQVTIDPIDTINPIVTEIKVRPRQDIQNVGVVFSFEQTVVVDGVQKVSIVQQHVGDIHSMDTIFHTFTLQSANEDIPEPIPMNLALHFYNATSALHYEGELTLAEQDCSFLISPGKALNFAASTPAKYQTMKALVQQTQFELVSGSTNVIFGPPKQLGPQEFAALIAASKTGTPSTNLPHTGATDGGTGGTTAPNSSNPFGEGVQTKLQLELCDGTSVCVIGTASGCLT